MIHLRHIRDKIKYWLQNIKQKIIEFDIKPAQPIMPQLLQQVDLALEQGNYLRAEKLLRKALAINNTNHAALNKTINLHITFGRFKQAISLLNFAIKLYPQDHAFKRLLGFMHLRRKNFAASAKAYQQALDLNPNSPEVQHFLAATLHQNTDRAPRDYIINLFNTYAENFENSLVQRLGYQAHNKLVEFMRQHINVHTPLDLVLDLGCGTGLLGAALKQNFVIKNLVGVDLSSNMLAHAQAKDIYTILHNAEISEFLNTAQENADIIASTDVFIYIGELNTLLQQAYKLLKPGGFLAFSVEKLPWYAFSRANFKLQTTGRYQHALSYLQSLYKQHHFSKMYSQTIDLRKEYGNMVSGYLVLLQK